MTPGRREALSGFLGLYLRHRPASLGLRLEAGGWVGLRQFIEAAWHWGMSIGPSELTELVESDAQHAFTVDWPGDRIRANWGHTVAFPPEPEPAVPPGRLYTAVGNVELARVAADGLRRPRGVSLRASAGPLSTPGPVPGLGTSALLIDAHAMYLDGFLFRPSGEGTWLVEHVPSRFIRRADGAPLSEALAELPPALAIVPPPNISSGRPKTWEEWKASHWSTTAGVPAIRPTRPDAPPGEPTFSGQDAARHVRRDGIHPQVEFATALTAGRELNVCRQLDPDRLLCLVVVPERLSVWHYVFDGRTGNLLQRGTGGLPRYSG